MQVCIDIEKVPSTLPLEDERSWRITLQVMCWLRNEEKRSVCVVYSFIDDIDSFAWDGNTIGPLCGKLGNNTSVHSTFEIWGKMTHEFLWFSLPTWCNIKILLDWIINVIDVFCFTWYSSRQLPFNVFYHVIWWLLVTLGVDKFFPMLTWCSLCVYLLMRNCWLVMIFP